MLNTTCKLAMSISRTHEFKIRVTFFVSDSYVGSSGLIDVRKVLRQNKTTLRFELAQAPKYQRVRIDDNKLCTVQAVVICRHYK